MWVGSAPWRLWHASKGRARHLIDRLNGAPRWLGGYFLDELVPLCAPLRRCRYVAGRDGDDLRLALDVGGAFDDFLRSLALDPDVHRDRHEPATIDGVSCWLHHRAPIVAISVVGTSPRLEARDFSRAAKLEAFIEQVGGPLGLTFVDPPVNDRCCFCPKYYPEFF